jgi:hypothetical protein
MKGHPSWMPGLAKLLFYYYLITTLKMLSCRRGYENTFFAAHNQHYTVLLKSVHGIGQDVRGRPG